MSLISGHPCEVSGATQGAGWHASLQLCGWSCGWGDLEVAVDDAVPAGGGFAELPRQSPRRGRQKLFPPQGSRFKKSEAYQGTLWNESTPSNTLAWWIRSLVDDPEDASEKRYVLIDRAWMRFWRIRFWSKSWKVSVSGLEQSAQKRGS